MFRSVAQLSILGEVFCGTRSHTITELADLAGTNLATASREVAILAECGVVEIVHGPGNAKLISPDPGLAYGPDLRRILAHTYGLLPRLRTMMEGDDRVEQVWIFGSWARRYHGERGHFPHDIDVAVVTSASPFDLLLPWLDIDRELGIEINPLYRHPDAFSLDDPLWADTPMVRVK